MSTLKALWNEYLMEQRRKTDLGTDDALKKLQACSKALRSELSAEQISKLDEYDRINDEIGRICQQNAFKRGVSFAVRFMSEAFSGE